MERVSDKWEQKFNETLVPETFVEITIDVTAPGANEKAKFVTSGMSDFADTSELSKLDKKSLVRYGTGEPNLCVLDGSCKVVPASAPYGNAGFVSAKIVSTSNHPILRATFPSKITSTLPGITVVWSSIFNEYATSFKVTSYLETKALNSVTVTGNKSISSEAEIELSGFDAIEVEVLDWCIPNRKARVEQLRIGQYLIFDKTKILSYSHTSSRDPISGQLSQDSISFSLDNSDRTWDSVNPQGIYKYIYERQPVSVRYGMDVDGTVEWVNGGKFFLSEWSVPSNSLEAKFSARDSFLYLMATTYTGRKYGTLYEMCYDALELLEADGITFDLSAELKDYSADISSDGSSYKNSDILQLAANAAGMALYQTRDGVITIKRAYEFGSGTDVKDITLLNNYSWPEITFAQNLLNVTTSVGGKTYAYPENPSGRGVSQSLSNALLSESTLTKSRNALTESYSVLSNRRKATLEYRASPTTDALDFVKIHHQFDYSATLLLTSASYTFNGCFKGKLEGYMMADVQSLTVDKSSEVLDWGQSVVVTATLAPASQDSPKINWSASPEGIVSLHVLTNVEGKSTCRVKWNSPGTATVTASAGGNSASCSFKTTAYYLSGIAEGETVLMDEGGNVAEFIVAKHDYESELNGAGRTLLVRKHYATIREWDSSWSRYASSGVNYWLNNDYFNSFTSAQKNAINETTIYYTPGFSDSYCNSGSGKVTTMARSVFLLSEHEFGYDSKGSDTPSWTTSSPTYTHNEGTPLPNASKILKAMLVSGLEGSNRGRSIWTRTPDLNSLQILRDIAGTSSSADKYWRPLIVSKLARSYILYNSSSDINISAETISYATNDEGPLKYDNVVHPAFTVPKSLAIDADGKLIF